MSKTKQAINDHIRETRLFNRRTIILAGILLLFAATLIARLVFLQLIEHKRYTTLSQRNQLNLVPIRPNRGLIYDRNKVLLAENVPTFSLEVIPERVKNIKQTIAELRKIIDITDEDLKQFNKLRKQRRSFDSIPIKLKLSPEDVARFSVNSFQFPGMSIKAQLIRHYPFGSSMGHVLGYVGRINERELQTLDPSNYSATNFVGKVGIEKFYEDKLHGQVGNEQVETDASGRVIRTIKRTAPTPGANLYLTIDSGLQIAAEHALGEHKGAVVAIDPSNGEILCLVSQPGFDPNVFVKGISSKNYRKLSQDKSQPLFNRAIRGQYPLASTIKPFLVVGAFNQGIVTPKYRINDKGVFKLPYSSILYRDWKKNGHGWMNATRAIIVSCDTYFYNLASLMGISRIDSILTKFGFGIKTEVDMGEELPGLVPSPAWKRKTKGKSWYPGDTIISGIGQGFMLTTPIQLAAATAAVATRGHRWQVHLLRSKQLSDGTTINTPLKAEYSLELKHQWIWDKVIHAMREVITSWEGTAGRRFGRDAPYTVAGKTGTAQVFSSRRHEAYEEEETNIPEHLRDHSLFIAFAPVKHPKIAIAVVVENSNKAPKVARKVMDYYLLTEHHWKPTDKEGKVHPSLQASPPLEREQ